MTPPRRQPLAPPKAFTQAVRTAESKQRPAIVDGIHVLPPTAKRPTWRLVVTVNKQRLERSGGRTCESAFAAFTSLVAERASAEASRAGRPEHGRQALGAVIAGYVSGGGRSGTWKPKTLAQRRGDFRELERLARAEGLCCADLNATHLRRALQVTVATESRAETVLRAFGAFLKWGWQSGYLTAEQSVLYAQIRWNPPMGYQRQRTRKQRAAGSQIGSDASRGQIPTSEQVVFLAKEVQKHHPFGEAIVIASAVLGTRINELAALTADPAVCERGLGNFVDLVRYEVVIACQLGDGTLARTTKTERERRTAIPARALIAGGFDLRAFLAERGSAALEEQRLGTNPHALLFTSLRGRPLNIDNFRARAFRPAAEALGMALQPTRDAKGRTRTMLRFSVHTLRDFFAITALYSWGYTDLQLMQQGGWASVETIRRHYIGTTDDTLRQVHEFHGRGGQPLMRVV